MNKDVNGLAVRELPLIGLYMELTGASESAARSVFIYICGRECGDAGMPEDADPDILRWEEPARNTFARDFGEMSEWLSRALAVPSGG